MANERWKREGAASREVKQEAKRPPAGSVTKHRDETESTRKSAQRVRIIGGLWKRTPLAVANVAGLRPTPDRVRETLFNWIGYLTPDLEAVRALDLFAGTGALGFELASRGARRVTLVESNRQLVDQLAQVKHRLVAEQVEIVAGDALSVAARWPDASFEIVLLDPPFDSSLLSPALAAAARLITPDGLIYVESGAPVDESLLDKHGLQVARVSRAGRVHFHLLQRRSA